MKQNKKGFTLIELLAVIVILAIIALIAIPIVMNIIGKTNKSAFKDSSYGVIKAGELYYAEQLLEPNGMEQNQTFEFPNNIGNLQIKGSLPSSGNMKVSKEGKVAIAISNGKYCVKKGYTDNDVTIDENIDDCKLPKELVVSGIMSSYDSCIKSNTVCPNGALVNVKVNDSSNHDFYVIKDTGTQLTLIMDRNLGNNIAWITEVDYVKAGGTNWDDGNVEKGPLTSLNTLEERTTSWSNIPTMIYTLTDDDIALYQPLTRTNVRARMLTYTEAKALGCVDYDIDSCPNYLYTNTYSDSGYWLSTSYGYDIHNGWFVEYQGFTYINYVYDSFHGEFGSANGVRPVITLSKTL